MADEDADALANDMVIKRRAVPSDDIGLAFSADGTQIIRVAQWIQARFTKLFSRPLLSEPIKGPERELAQAIVDERNRATKACGYNVCGIDGAAEI